MIRLLAAGLLLLAVTSRSLAAGDPGAALYAEHCAHCHETGQGRAPTRVALQSMGPDLILQALESGSMRVLGTMLLDAKDRVAVAGYLAGKPPTQVITRPADATCIASRLPGPGIDPVRGSGWNGWGNGPENHRFQSREAGLSAADVPRLTLQWAFAFPGQGSVNAQPTIADGRLFTGSMDGTVYALDAVRGCVLWTFKARAAVRTAIVLSASAGRMLAYFGDGKANAYAVDAETGAQVWQKRVDDHPAARLTGGFQYVDGKVLIPVSSIEEVLAAAPGYVCCSFRGKVIALDAVTGAELWRRYTIDGSAGSGAAVWSTPAVSAHHRLVYVSTGNNYSAPATPTSDAVLALHVDTGQVAWVFQGTAGDAWNTACLTPGSDRCPDRPGGDTDMAAAPVLVASSAGEMVVAAQKSGVIHALEAGTGAMIWQRRLGRGGVSGGIQWGPATDGRLLYAAISDVVYRPQGDVGLDVEPDPDAGGGLFAMDLRTGAVNWQAAPTSCAGRSRCSPAQSAAVSLIPGAVFSGSLGGVVRAHDARDGALLWEYDTVREYTTVNGIPGHGGGLDGPGVVAAAGRVYVTSGYGLFGALPGNVLLAFAPAVTTGP